MCLMCSLLMYKNSVCYNRHYLCLCKLLYFGVLCISLFIFVGCSDEQLPLSNTSQETPVSVHSKPNIVLIIVDTLRADRLDMKREDVALMPFMRSFAQESWRYTNATAQATWTRPSMASIFTSLYAGVHNQQFGIRLEVVKGQDHTVDVLPDTIETMASFFKKAGYSTAGIQANWNMESVFGVAQGFDSYEMIPHEQNAADITILSLNTIKDFRGPFFFYVHYVDPHAPYEPPERYRRLFEEIPEITSADREMLADYGPAYYTEKVKWDLGFQDTPPVNQLSEDGREYIEIMYDGEVRFTDDELARLINGIRKEHPNTVIIFASDHGEEFWERGSIGHGRTVYEEASHVPLIFSFPDELPKVVTQRVELIDVLPTLAAYLKLPARDWWQGRNLLHTSTSETDRVTFTQTMTSVRETHVFLLGVLQENWKLIFDVAGDVYRQYNLEEDPLEKNPVVNDLIFDKMQEHAEQYLKENQNHPLYSQPTVTQTLDAETEEMLRAQGYL